MTQIDGKKLRQYVDRMIEPRLVKAFCKPVAPREKRARERYMKLMAFALSGLYKGAK